jgi:hypothetical protein
MLIALGHLPDGVGVQGGAERDPIGSISMPLCI